MFLFTGVRIERYKAIMDEVIARALKHLKCTFAALDSLDQQNHQNQSMYIGIEFL